MLPGRVILTTFREISNSLALDCTTALLRPRASAISSVRAPDRVIVPLVSMLGREGAGSSFRQRTGACLRDAQSQREECSSSSWWLPRSLELASDLGKSSAPSSKLSQPLVIQRGPVHRFASAFRHCRYFFTFGPSSTRQWMASEREPISCSVDQAWTFSINESGNRTPTKGSRPVAGRPLFDFTVIAFLII